MSKILIQTVAYNAEKTIARTIESVLKQTYTDFVYEICDNGSEDDTGKIIEKYSASDSRIVVYRNEKNYVWDNREILEHRYNLPDDDYLCFLDADDEYLPNFMEDMLTFAEKENLDMVACGSHLIDAKTGNLLDARQCVTPIIVRDVGFSTYFHSYHWFTRATWGKLYKGFLLHDYDDRQHVSLSYGNDTYFVYKALRKATSFGVFNGYHHKYYIQSKSSSFAFNPKRVEDDRILYNDAVDFLQTKCGVLTQKNQLTLYTVYFNAINDTVKTLFNSNIAAYEKLSNLRDIFSSNITKEVVEAPISQICDKSGLLKEIIKNIFNLKEYTKSGNIEIVSEIISDMGIIPERFVANKADILFFVTKMQSVLLCLIDGNYEIALTILNTTYKSAKKDIPCIHNLEIVLYAETSKSFPETILLLLSIIKKFPKSADELDLKNVFMRKLEKISLLQGYDIDFYVRYPDLLHAILCNDFQSALDTGIKLDKPNKTDFDFYSLMQRISAMLENTDKFIYFKKQGIAYLIKNNRIDEALTELSDYDIVMPNDAEFKAFREKLKE